MKNQYDIIHLPDGMVVVDKDANIKQADEGYYVYCNTDNAYFTKGVHLLQPFSSTKDHFDLFRPESNPMQSSYVVLKQDKQSQDYNDGYKFCNVKYLQKIIAASPSINLEGIPLLPSFSDDRSNENLYRLFKQTWESFSPNLVKKVDEFEWFKEGYYVRAAQAKQYSIEDIEKIIDVISDKLPELKKLQTSQADDYGNVRSTVSGIVHGAISTPKLPKGVVLEMEETCDVKRGSCDCSEQDIDCQCKSWKPKTDAQGFVIVKEWIWN